MSDFEFYNPIPVKTPKSHVRKKKIPKWKKVLHNYGFYIICAIVIAAIVLGIVLICKGCSKTPDTSDFDGTYYIDDYTAYEFDGKGKGAMCLGETTRYVFCYSIKDDKISFDFEDSRINDPTYTFNINKDTITLTENGGTATYTLKKK